MRELLRTTDPERISYIEALLHGEGIECVVLDANTGSLIAGAILPRIMVADEDFAAAQALVDKADEAS